MWSAWSSGRRSGGWCWSSGVLSARSRLTGLARETVAKAMRAEVPPRYERAPAVSKLDPFKEWICEQWRRGRPPRNARC